MARSVSGEFFHYMNEHEDDIIVGILSQNFRSAQELHDQTIHRQLSTIKKEAFNSRLLVDKLAIFSV